MIARSTHLKDDRLFDCYVSAQAGEMVDPPSAEHLAECADCTRRYAELTMFMDGLRDEADAELEELFPAERLLAQEQNILRRLTHIHRPARVISFPARELAAAMPASGRVPPRWLAAAAAAGLFIGVAVGGFFGPASIRRNPPMQVASAPMSAPRTTSTPAVRANTPADAPDDDAFLLQLEMSLAQPTLRELQPFDALTPQVREIGTRVR